MQWENLPKLKNRSYSYEIWKNTIATVDVLSQLRNRKARVSFEKTITESTILDQRMKHAFIKF